jgi:hypothetical protein
MKKSICVLLTVLAASAYADTFTVTTLDAGKLRLNAATAMSTGSLLIMVAAGGDGTFSNSLAPGQYVSGNDVLLSAIAFPGSAGGFNNAGGTDETNNTLSDLPVTSQGDLIALRWFPQITYAQWQAGATPTAGQNYGTYNPLAAGNATNNPDGGNVWAEPAGGANINLNFFTTDTGAGTQAPAEGYANFTVTAVPEPSTFALAVLGSSTIGLAMLRRRVKR